MEKCLKILNLLIEKKIAEADKDILRACEYYGMIKSHVKHCSSCRRFLEKISVRLSSEENKKI